jgi:hypothetical protein
MKKALKWGGIILGSLFALFLVAAILIPVLFKDDIVAAIDKEIEKSVNAKVIYDVDKFNITLFKNFPNLTVQINELGVINNEPFENTLLFATDEFNLVVNLKDILFGDQLRIKGISLVKTVVNVVVLPDGRANWDIMKPSEEVEEEPSEPSNFSFGIDQWKLVDADITYDDQSIPFKMTLLHMNHEGSGDFTQDVFDLKTKTIADSVSIWFDGTEYLTNKRFDIDATIAISEDYTKYTFKENSAKVNDFALSFDGWFKMNENDFGMDINFGSPENLFKSLLSLVPGMYTDSFKDIETKGDLSFKGFVKGTYSEQQMPAFNVNLLVHDAMFKYAALPTAVNNINVDLLIDNKDGIIDNTIIDLKKMHLDFGSNPVDARALITKIYPTNVDANVKARLNLAELSQMFPLDGLTLKGNYTVDMDAKGIYDSLKKTIPAIDATMALSNGYVKSAEFPIPLEDLKTHATIKNTSGKMEETFITVKDFSMLMDGEKFNADLFIQNLADITWDLKAKGGVDLEKITKVFPIEGMTLAGKVKADLETKGKLSDLEAEKYDRLPTSGSASLRDFKYIDKELPYTVTLSQANMVFDPKKIEMQNVKGTIGKSDFDVSGSVLNYMGYLFGTQTIKGVVNFSSNLLDLNEFMTDTEETTTTDTAALSVFPIPTNIDFTLKSKVNRVNVMDLSLTNASGDVIVRDGVANLSGLRFNMLGGTFGVNGSYNTKDIKHPKYDLALKIENVSMREASNASSLITTYAPIAGLVNGNFSTDFKINGELLQDMSPNLATVNGSGLIKIAQAALKDSKLISGITSLTKLENTNEVTLKDVLMSASLKDGKLSVQPFDVKFGDYKTTVAGNTSLDGKMDYTLKMDVPAGKLGAQFNNWVAQHTTGGSDANKNIPVTIGLGGFFNSPTTTLIMDEQKAQVKEAVTNVAKEEGTKIIQEAVKGTEAEKLVKGLLGGGSSKTDTTNTKSDSTKTTTTSPSTSKEVEQAKDLIKGILKKKN